MSFFYRILSFSTFYEYRKYDQDISALFPHILQIQYLIFTQICRCVIILLDLAIFVCERDTHSYNPGCPVAHNPPAWILD